MGFGERGGGWKGAVGRAPGSGGLGEQGFFRGGGGRGLLANGFREWGFWQTGLGDGAFGKWVSGMGLLRRERARRGGLVGSGVLGVFLGDQTFRDHILGEQDPPSVF